MENMQAQIDRLMYHQRLLLKMVRTEGMEFDRLVIEKSLDEREVEEFFSLCERLEKEREKQKAENFVFYSPLFREFLFKLNEKLPVKEVIDACLKQKIYPELMKAFQKNLD